jgi:hypothetical protein
MSAIQPNLPVEDAAPLTPISGVPTLTATAAST